MHHQINQLLAKAIQSFHNGRFDEAEHTLRLVIKSQSKNFDALHILGILKGIQNQHQEALEIFNKALKIDPNNQYLNLNIAKAFLETGQNDRALKYFRNATKLNPNNPEIWFGYGKCLSELNNLRDSLNAYKEAINLNPFYIEAWVNQGCVLRKLKFHNEALASFEKALEINSDNTEALSNRGAVLQELSEYEQSLASFDKAISIKPNYAQAWTNRGNSLQKLDQYELALASHDKAISIEPDYAEAWYNRGNTLQELNQYELALASYDKAISIKPDYAEAWCNRGITLKDIGNFSLAVASYREAIKLDPESLVARSNLLFTLNYIDELTPQFGMNEAKIFGFKVTEKAKPKFTTWNVPAKPEKLRIGFVSGDLRNHPVGYFVEGLFEKLDRSQFQIFAFPTTPIIDDLTKRIKPLFAGWTSIYGMSDQAAATLIHQTGIQVLIDLSGHTAHNRLVVFSYKPAPVQISWLGYFATTGLPEMDYFLGDPQMSPKCEATHFTETVWNMAETWLCRMPPVYMTSVSTLPYLNNGFLTFGSFGNLSKMNNKVIETWSSILNKIPGSKLMLKSGQLVDPWLREEVKSRFQKFEISNERLILDVPGSIESYYEAYKRVDIVLDTFPYPGGTTSLDALWMGVPVLTLKGDRFLSHLGESIAINSGNRDWVASNIEHYISKAVLFSSNPDQLVYLRGALKDRVLKSPLFSTSRFAKNFGDACWGMWNQWSQKKIGLTD